MPLSYPLVPPPLPHASSSTPTSTCDKLMERQVYLSQGVRNIKAFTHLRYPCHCSVQSRKDALCVCSARVSLANLSLYNLCHSYRICTLCLMCHESAANWSATAANPKSDKWRVGKAGISTPYLIAKWICISGCPDVTMNREIFGSKYSGHVGLLFSSEGWHNAQYWPMKTSKWRHVIIAIKTCAGTVWGSLGV